MSMRRETGRVGEAEDVLHVDKNADTGGIARAWRPPDAYLLGGGIAHARSLSLRSVLQQGGGRLTSDLFDDLNLLVWVLDMGRPSGPVITEIKQILYSLYFQIVIVFDFLNHVWLFILFKIFI
jgi:hypothetical protein